MSVLHLFYFSLSVFVFPLLLGEGVGYAQAPQGINYQGVARNATGSAISNTVIAVQFQIHSGAPGGTVVFNENHPTVATDTFGLYTRVIGSANPSQFSTINWSSGSMYLEIYINGTSIATAQLMSVPYALYAGSAGSSSTGVTSVTTNTTLSTTGTATNVIIGMPNILGSGGSVGSATAIPVITYDAYGRITAVSTQTFTTSGGTVTSITGGTGILGGPITTTGTISADNTNAIWNANQIQYKPVTLTGLINGQILQFNGTDWVNTTPPAAGVTTTVTVSSPSPLSVTGSVASPTLSISQATGTSGGYLTTGDWNTFNNKVSTITTNTTQLTTTGTTTVNLGLATVPTLTAGAYGSASAIPTFTVDAFGRVTGAATTTFTAGGITSVTGTLPITTTTSSGTVTVGLGPVGAPVNTYGTVSAFPIISVDASGRVTGATTQTFTAGTVTSVSTNTTLTGGPITTTGTIGLATVPTLTVGTYGSSTNIPVITVDTYGRVTNATTQTFTAGTVSSVAGVGPALSGTVTSTGTITANNGAALWNANQLQNIGINATPPTPGQVLQYNGTQWSPFMPPPAGVGGSGTLNYVPKFTPTGTALGNSLIFDNGTNIGIGTTAPFSKLHVAGNNPNSIINQVAENVTANLQSGILMQRSRGTIAAPTTVISGDALGGFYMMGHDGTSFGSNGPSAGMFALAAENFTTTGHGSELHFLTTPTGTNSFIDRMIITNAGNVGLGTITPASALHIYRSGSGNTPNIWLEAAAVDGLTNAGIIFKNGANRVDVWHDAFSTSFFTNVPTGYKTVWRINNVDKMTLDPSGKVGIGTNTPTSQLQVIGKTTTDSLKIISGAAVGKVLTSDAVGNATWQIPGGGIGGAGTLNYVSKFTPTGTAIGNSIIFDNGTNVGIGTNAPAQLFSVANLFVVDATGHAMGIAGSIGNPSFSFVGNANTGMYNPAANVLGFTTNALERVRIDANGNVGIGTPSPVTRFEIDDVSAFKVRLNRAGGVGYKSEINFASSGVDFFSIGIDRAQSSAKEFFIFDNTAGVDRLLINAAGNVGIGTITPVAKLDVTSNSFNVLHLGTTAANTNVNIDLAPTGAGAVQFAISGSTGGYSFLTPGFGITPVLKLTDNGKVGIGTNAPTSQLQVIGKTTTDSLKVISGAAAGKVLTSDAVGNATWQLPGAASAWLLTGNAASAGNFIGTTNAFPLNISTTNTVTAQPIIFSTSATEKMRIDPLGNVGIGTTLPAAPLHIKSTAAEVIVENTGGAFKTGYTIKTALQEWFVGQESGAPQEFRIKDITAAQVRMEIAPNGNVGIGTTIPTSRLQIIGKTTTDSLKVIAGASAGKVLTSDAAGNATWQLPGGGGAWSLTGNVGTVAGNFVGTTEADLLHPLRFKVGNQPSGIIDANGPTFFGYMAGNVNTATFNTGVGSKTLFSNTSGDFNTAYGAQALYNNTTGIDNTASGLNALNANTIGNYNTAYGASALFSNNTGNNNTTVGFRAGYTGVGANANTSGSNNTFIGYQSGPGTPTQLTNATAIGYQALVSANNSLVLGGTGVDAVNVGIGTTAPISTLKVNGSMAGNFINPASANYVCTAKDYFVFVTINGAIMLPTANSVNAGSVIIIRNNTPANISVGRQGTDQIFPMNTTAGQISVPIAFPGGAGPSMGRYISDGVGSWIEW